MVKIQLQNSQTADVPVNNTGSSGADVPLFLRLIDNHVAYDFGWSFAAAVLCDILGVIGAYVFFASGNAIRLRRKTIQRRLRVRTMLMTSCQHEVALAMRAKLVIRD